MAEPLTGDDPGEAGGYRLRARLGAGAMGQVYLALTPGGRQVAIKMVRAEFGGDEQFRARFRQEVAAAQRVHGLFTAQVLEADPDASRPWLATSYVPGLSLREAVTGMARCRRTRCSSCSPASPRPSRPSTRPASFTGTSSRPT